MAGDNSRIFLFQVNVAQLHSVGQIAAEIREHTMADCYQTMEGLHSHGVLQVQGQAAGVAVESLEIDAVIDTIDEEWWNGSGHIPIREGVLNLDDVSTKLG